LSSQVSLAWLKQPGCRREIERWIRFTDREARKHGDGLDASSLGLMPFDLFAAFRLPGSLRSWTGGELPERAGRDPGPVPTMGILAGVFQQTKEAYRAGEFLMRFWLECTRRGLYLQPLANLVTDAQAARRCEQHWRVRDIWLEFKIGRSRIPAKSYRRSVEDILLEEELLTVAAPPTSPATSDRRS
jgi:hypothetical protein